MNDVKRLHCKFSWFDNSECFTVNDIDTLFDISKNDVNQPNTKQQKIPTNMKYNKTTRQNKKL